MRISESVSLPIVPIIHISPSDLVLHAKTAEIRALTAPNTYKLSADGTRLYVDSLIAREEPNREILSRITLPELDLLPTPLARILAAGSGIATALSPEHGVLLDALGICIQIQIEAGQTAPFYIPYKVLAKFMRKSGRTSPDFIQHIDRLLIEGNLLPMTRTLRVRKKGELQTNPFQETKGSGNYCLSPTETRLNKGRQRFYFYPVSALDVPVLYGGNPSLAIELYGMPVFYQISLERHHVKKITAGAVSGNSKSNAEGAQAAYAYLQQLAAFPRRKHSKDGYFVGEFFKRHQITSHKSRYVEYLIRAGEQLEQEGMIEGFSLLISRTPSGRADYNRSKIQFQQVKGNGIKRR